MDFKRKSTGYFNVQHNNNNKVFVWWYRHENLYSLWSATNANTKRIFLRTKKNSRSQIQTDLNRTNIYLVSIYKYFTLYLPTHAMTFCGLIQKLLTDNRHITHPHPWSKIMQINLQKKKKMFIQKLYTIYNFTTSFFNNKKKNVKYR